MFKLFFSKRISSVKDLDLTYPLFLPHQIHSDEMVYIDENNINQKIDADACITDKRNLAIGVKTADCVPILIYDRTRKVVGAVHSGWKGTVKKIAYKTVISMIKKFSSNPSDIHAVIGPAICGRCYGVKEDVFNIFLKEFGKDLVFKKSAEHYFIDLKTLNRDILINAGIKKENIYIIPYCTSCSNDEYHSFRKNKNTSSFQISYCVII